MRFSVITISACAALLLVTVARAQQPAAPASPPPPPPAIGAPITLEQAKAAIAAATEESKKNSWNHVFAVVDGGGNLIAFEKADLAGNASINIAQGQGDIISHLSGAHQSLPRSPRSGRNLHIRFAGYGTGGGRSANCCQWQTYWRHRCKRRNAIAGSSIWGSRCSGCEVTKQIRKGRILIRAHSKEAASVGGLLL